MVLFNQLMDALVVGCVRGLCLGICVYGVVVLVRHLIKGIRKLIGKIRK